MTKYKYVGPPNLFYPGLGISPVPGDTVELPTFDHPSFLAVEVEKKKQPETTEDPDGVRN
jgi:hypothetical protein